MSATLGGGLARRLQTLMEPSSLSKEVEILTSEGMAYPVSVTHLGPWSREEGMEGGVVDAVVMALRRHEEGDVLAFLPGGRHLSCHLSLDHPYLPSCHDT